MMCTSLTTSSMKTPKNTKTTTTLQRRYTFWNAFPLSSLFFFRAVDGEFKVKSLLSSYSKTMYMSKYILYVCDDMMSLFFLSRRESTTSRRRSLHPLRQRFGVIRARVVEDGQDAENQKDAAADHGDFLFGYFLS